MRRVMENEPKNRVDLYMVILLVLAAALIFGVIGFAYGQQVATESAGLTNTTSTVNYSASAVPSATKTTTATADVTANWKTYTNTDYGFSFKYPGDWRKEENSGEGIVQLYDGAEAGRELLPTETKIIVYKPLAENVVGDLENYVKKNYGKINSSTDVTVGGIASKQFVTTPQVFGTKTTTTYILKDATYYIITCMENATDLNSIISTFQFTK